MKEARPIRPEVQEGSVTLGTVNASIGNVRRTFKRVPRVKSSGTESRLRVTGRVPADQSTRTTHARSLEVA